MVSCGVVLEQMCCFDYDSHERSKTTNKRDATGLMSLVILVRKEVTPVGEVSDGLLKS